MYQWISQTILCRRALSIICICGLLFLFYSFFPSIKNNQLISKLNKDPLQFTNTHSRTRTAWYHLKNSWTESFCNFLCSKGNPTYSYLKNLLVQTCVFNKWRKINSNVLFSKGVFLFNAFSINFFPIYELLYLWKITLGQILKQPLVWKGNWVSVSLVFVFFFKLGKMYFHSTNVNYSLIRCKILSYNRHVMRYQDRSGMVLVLKMLSSSKYDNWDIQNSIEISRPIIWNII